MSSSLGSLGASPEARLIRSSSPCPKVALVLHGVSCVPSEVLLHPASRILLLVLIRLPRFAPTVLLVLILIRPSRSLVAVLVLHTFLRQQHLLGSENVADFSEFLVAMSEVALLLEQAVLVSFEMSAALGLVFLIELLDLLLLSVVLGRVTMLDRGAGWLLRCCDLGTMG